VVVVCEKCHTRFHLDDSRVPAEGARVRCSRCKHAFFITCPGSEEADAIDEVVAEVTGPGETPVPEVTQDLLDPNPERGEPKPRQRPAQVRAEEAGREEFEEDWKFNDDSLSELPARAEPEATGIGEFDATALDLAGEPSDPQMAADGADSIGEPEPEVSPVEKPPQIDPVEAIRARDVGLDSFSGHDLGSPEEWDFVGTAKDEPRVEPAPEDSVPEPAVPSADEASSASPSSELSDSPTAALATRVESDRLPLTTRLAGLASIVSWVLVALAFSVGISAVFTQPGERTATSAGPVEITVSGLTLTATEVRSRLVENALTGNLLVVSGNLENRGWSAVTPRRAVWVQLVSAGGEPIAGATAAAGRALDERRLREEDPDRLRRDLERSAAGRAHRPFRPGERVRFDAVFESIPESATGWVLQAASLPSRPDPGNSPPSTAPLASE
jgi:predicted Zn finger-like uncharacterized protein